MTSISKIYGRVGFKWIAILLFTCFLSLLTAKPASAEVRCVADLGGLLDGYVTPNPPTQIQVDGNCTIRNFPASNPLTTNFSFYTSPGTNNERWLLIFDNVVHTGQMSCDKVQGHHIWFVNSSSSGIKPSCQNQFVPVEKISKLTPGPTASIGVPFTYRLVIPVLFDPVSGTVINSSGSANDLHDISVTDDLNATGVDMTFVSERAYWLGSGAAIPHTFSNSGGFLSFGGFPIVPAGTQFVIEITVVLPDTLNNTPGKQFVNTAKWQFGRLIDGIFYEPLPGEWGISPPMTIAAPTLTVTKSGPATLNLSQWGTFGINAQNSGTSDAWNTTISDRLPSGANGGMCNRTPEILSAQVFASDGVTPVPGKGPLTAGSDYSFSYSNCQLDMTMLTAAGTISPGQRLIIRYRTQLDANTQTGVALTNVAGAIQWFNGDSSNSNRKGFTRTLTDGTPGVLDFQDAFTVNTALTGYFFDKTVANVTTGVNPTTTAKPGDKLRYTLRFRSPGQALSNFSIVDEMDALNATADFAPGTLTLISSPAGSDTSNTSSTGGAKGTGIIDIRNINIAATGEAVIQIDITLKSGLTDGTIVSNQATARLANNTTVLSDDPNVNGQADPNIAGDEDPTRVRIVTTPPLFRVQKISTDLTGDPNVLLPGDRLRYTITVKNIGGADAVNAMLRDAIPANTTYVAGSTTLNGVTVADVLGLSPLANGMLINSPANATPGLMPADASSSTANVATITFDVTVSPNAIAGTVISNQGFVSATGITDQPSDDPRTSAPNDPTINIVGTVPLPILMFTKSGPSTMNLGQWGTFGIDIQNTGTVDAWNTTIRDLLPHGTTGGMCNQAPEILSAQVFAADGVTPAPGKGALNAGSDYSMSYTAAPNCQLDITILTAAGTIAPNQRLIIRYRTQLDANTQNGVALTNIAGAIQWFNADSSNTGRNTSTGILTDGTPGTPDNQDAHTVTASLSGYFFDKTVANLTSGANPATTAVPGDKLRYTLRFRPGSQALSSFSIVDDMDSLNAQGAFAPGTLTLVSTPAGADVSATNSTGGTKGTGIIDIRNLNVGINGDIQIQFDITLKSTLANNTVVANQATLRLTNGTVFALSDDPNVNGSADSAVSGDEDPTKVTIVSAAAFRVQKISTDLTGDPNVLLPGERLRYTITVKNISTADAPNTVLRDAIPANTTYVANSTTLNGAAVADVTPGQSALPTGMQINSPANSTPGLMPADASSSTANVATITFDVIVNSNAAAGTVISNQGFVNATGLTDQPSDDPRTPAPNDPTINIVGSLAGPELVVTKSGPATMNLAQWGTFGIDVQNTAPSDAWNATIRDLLPHGTTGGMCNLTPEILSAQVFAADGVTPVPGKGALTAGSDYSLNYTAAPNCQLDITMLTAAGTIGPNQRLIIRYRTQLDASTQNGVALTNIAGAIQWFNADSSNANRKTSTGPLTNGTPGVADNQDAHTVTVALSGYFFEKTVENLRSGANPTTTAVPGDKLRYTLRFRSGSQALSNFSIVDEMDALNAQADFAPGSLTLVATPAGADTSATSSTGGTKGTGVIDIRNLTVPINGDISIQFDITLKSALANDTIVSNQATLRLANGTVFALSDDPNVNGVADPNVSGDEDPTRVKIVSSSIFRVQKISAYLRDPNILLAGDTMRYTITVKNISNADATNAMLRDAIPANTAYVAGSTTLNGTAVADVAGVSPLVNGMMINSPANATPGLMPADPSSSTANVATITFNVVVNANTPNGTVISNQGFVSATGITDQPSDDPRTPALNDPTIDIVGKQATPAGLYAEKRVALFGDKGSPGIVDPGDVLRYTITIKNSTATPATAVVLKDAVPANTTYVANSTLLDGSPFGQPDNGASPLAAGINIGTIAPGATATLQYDLLVNAGTPAGTVISNQAVVSSTGLPNVLTDGDGNPATGPEPTVIVVGAGQQISITNEVSVVGGGPAVPGAQLEYVVKVTNTASVPAYNVVMTDDVNAPQPNQLGYVNQSATMNGSTTGISFAGSTITGNYGAVSGPLAPGAVVEYRFRATLNANLTAGTVVTNTAVAAWNDPTQTVSASVSITVGSVPPPNGLGSLSGSVWYDANFDQVHDSSERSLAGWTVELYKDNQLSQSVQTDANGAYSIAAIDPNSGTSVHYELRFLAPGAGANTAMLGRAASPFTNGLQRISDIIVSSNANLQGLNLPIRPNGVVYNSSTRAPIVGATVTLMDAGSASPLPAACFDDAAQQGQITLADGYYRFDINFSDPACPSGGDYLIGVTAPAGANYVAGYSQIIPPKSNASTAAFSVPSCPGSAADVIPSTSLFCEVQPSEFAPAASVPAGSVGTTYYVHLTLDSSQIPGTSQIFNNHIAIDPQVAGTLSLSKTTPALNVTRGQIVPYVITATNRTNLMATDVTIVDRLPAGFTYVKGSALLDGIPSEPVIASGTLTWNGVIIDGNKARALKLLVVAGAGINEGEFVNRAQALSGATGNAMSGEATATVRIVPDVTFDCTDVTGKVFNDVNRNGRQDDGEEGLAGVRVVTARGLQATTDQYGRYHITCAVTPNENRGSNFVLKLDDRTLPSGFRLTTDQVQIQRATRGKALRINYGASIHRSVSIDLSDAAFEPG
ncbi:MAG TPA: hypothetical protein VFU28_21620, partial [Vicinamibacterales bacterium]|nr:hypothetical protein [Vicinamibacterales bacterium]